jgi:hypothetical protein
MLRTALALVAFVGLAGCATQAPPPAPPPSPPPVIISDQSASTTSAEAVPETPEPPPPPPPAQPAKPQQTDGGRFRVGVVSAVSAEAAAPWVSKLQAAGYRTEILPVEIDGKTWHRVLLPGYANLEEARAVVPMVEQEFGLTGVWVTSRRRAPFPTGAAPAPEPAAMAAPAPAAEPAATRPPETTVEVPVEEKPQN